MLFDVTDVDLDFTDDQEGDIPLEFQQDTIADVLGTWTADDEDDLIEEITAACGWCVKSIDYKIVLS